VAIHETTIHPFPAQGRTPFTITSAEISRYAELSALVTELDAQQKALRAELLALRNAGAEQETDSPYMLAFIDQQRRNVDWKTHALELAEMLYGIEKAAKWKARVEQCAPVLPVTQVRVKPNPAYAAGLKKPAGSIRLAQVPDPRGPEVRFAD
jgi:hypothetical protein